MEVIQWEKPKTDREWAEDTKKENLDFKTDEQLQEMKVSHEEKLLRFEEQIDDLNACPGCRLFEIQKRLDSDPDLAKETTAQVLFDEEVRSLKESYEKLSQSVERINKEIDLRARGVVITDKVGAKEDLKPRSAGELKNKDKSLIRELNP
jgi:hypothetical protein